VAGDLLYKVAYDEAVRTLGEQQAVIESFRNRAGLLLSSAAVTTSFLGAQALPDGSSSPISWVALAGFAGVATTSLAILWPRRWEGAADPHDVIGTYIESAEPAPIEKLHRDLSVHMRSSYLKNREGLRNLLSSFKLLASCLLSR
jgi:hypothetical protein